MVQDGAVVGVPDRSEREQSATSDPRTDCKTRLPLLAADAPHAEGRVPQARVGDWMVVPVAGDARGKFR